MNNDKIQIYFETSEISCAAINTITDANSIPACKIHLWSSVAVTMYLLLWQYKDGPHHKQYSNINTDQGIHKFKYLCLSVCV